MENNSEKVNQLNKYIDIISRAAQVIDETKKSKIIWALINRLGAFNIESYHSPKYQNTRIPLLSVTDNFEFKMIIHNVNSKKNPIKKIYRLLNQFDKVGFVFVSGYDKNYFGKFNYLDIDKVNDNCYKTLHKGIKDYEIYHFVKSII